MNSSIGAVIVLYNPDMNILGKAIESLTPQVDEIILVDNSTSNNSAKFKDNVKVKYMPLMDNMGIAAAQNHGIKYIIEKKYDFIFLADQDSIWQDNLIFKLIAVSQNLDRNGFKPGIVAPNGINRLNGRPYYFDNSNKNAEFIIDNNIYEAYEQLEVIASGSLIKRDVILQAGGMDESLFIDLVDLEFCWRVKTITDYKVFIVPQIIFEHQIGQAEGKFLKKRFSIPSPFRHYYKYRNSIWLIKNHNYISEKQNKALLGLIKFAIYFSIVPKDRFKRMKYIMKGVKDGLFLKYTPLVPFISTPRPRSPIK